MQCRSPEQEHATTKMRLGLVMPIQKGPGQQYHERPLFVPQPRRTGQQCAAIPMEPGDLLNG